MTQRLRAPSFRTRLEGFTLVELMVVIVIIGIVSAVILPEMTGTLEHSKLRSSAREIIQAAGLAQGRAVSVSHEHRLNLNPENNRYWITRRSLDANLQEVYTEVKEVSGAEGTWDPSIKIEFQDPRIMEEEQGSDMEPQTAPMGPRSSRDLAIRPFISFNPDGTAGNMELILSHPNGTGLILKVLPATGRIRIKPKDTEF